MRVKLRMRHQAAVLHRNQHRVRDALARRNPQPFAGIELRHEMNRATKAQGRKKDDQRGV